MQQEVDMIAKVKNTAMMVVMAALVALMAVIPASAQITADAPTIDFELALQYTWGLFNAFGPMIWALFGLALVPFVIGLLWRLKP